jgi:hypothetical protein
MSNMIWDRFDYNDPTTFEDLFLGVIFDSLKRTNYAAKSIDVYNNLVKIKDDLLKKTSYHDDVLRAFDMAVEQLELNFDEFDEDKIQPQSNGDWLEVAESYLGTPYVFGGDSKNGIDCSAFVRKVFPDLPRTANDQMKVGVSIPIDNPLEWEPGDRIYFDMNARLKPGDADHTGIYLGNNEFIQASSSKGVTKTPINDYYRKRIIAVKR